MESAVRDAQSEVLFSICTFAVIALIDTEKSGQDIVQTFTQKFKQNPQKICHFVAGKSNFRTWKDAKPIYHVECTDSFDWNVGGKNHKHCVLLSNSSFLPSSETYRHPACKTPSVLRMF